MGSVPVVGDPATGTGAPAPVASSAGAVAPCSSARVPGVPSPAACDVNGSENHTVLPGRSWRISTPQASASDRTMESPRPWGASVAASCKVG